MNTRLGSHGTRPAARYGLIACLHMHVGMQELRAAGEGGGGRPGRHRGGVPPLHPDDARGLGSPTLAIVRAEHIVSESAQGVVCVASIVRPGRAHVRGVYRSAWPCVGRPIPSLGLL